MGTYEDLKKAIADVIYTNGNNEITGIVLQQILQRIVATIGMNATFAGIATPETDPREIDQNVIYLASEPGIYDNFNGQEITFGIGIFSNQSGEWEYMDLQINLSKSVTYAEVVALRNDETLIPGMLYRITDYITTTKQANTKSAGHPFDIIVLALSKSELSGQAWAVQSARDVNGYFAASDLNAWKIWYCLDNDTAKFAWADKENGKGVIYRMIDELNNDCPYDFKNIMFTRDGVLKYTFDGGGADNSFYYDNSNNHISSLTNADGKRQLNNIVFLNTNNFTVCAHNEIGPESFDITFGNNCSSNRIGSRCQNIKVGNEFKYNVIETSVKNITFKRFCQNNVIGTLCHDIQGGDSCRYIEFATACTNIKLLTNYMYLYFGAGCKNIDFSAAGNYIRYFKFEPGIDDVQIINYQTAASGALLKYFTFLMGDYGIRVNVSRNAFAEQFVGFDENHELTIKNPMI